MSFPGGIIQDLNPLRPLQFDQVLEGPFGFVIGLPLRTPFQWFSNQISANDDIGGIQAVNACRSAAEHDVFTGGLNRIVLDRIRTGSIDAVDGLVIDVILDLSDIGILDRGLAGIQRDAAAGAVSRVAMNVAMVDCEVLRLIREIGGVLIAEFHERDQARVLAANVETLQDVAIRARFGPNDRL